MLHALQFSSFNDRHVKSLQTCLNMAGVVPRQEQLKHERLIEKAKTLYLPDRGGSYQAWERRPLHPTLRDYAAADVKFMLDMKLRWESSGIDDLVVDITNRRIQQAVFQEQPPKGSKMAKRDFPLFDNVSLQVLLVGGGGGDAGYWSVGDLPFRVQVSFFVYEELPERLLTLRNQRLGQRSTNMRSRMSLYRALPDANQVPHFRTQQCSALTVGHAWDSSTPSSQQLPLCNPGWGVATLPIKACREWKWAGRRVHGSISARGLGNRFPSQGSTRLSVDKRS